MDRQQQDKQQIRLLLSPREAAKALGVCEKTLWTMTKQGEIPSLNIGRRVCYSVKALEEWIAEKSQESA